MREQTPRLRRLNQSKTSKTKVFVTEGTEFVGITVVEEFLKAANSFEVLVRSDSFAQEAQKLRKSTLRGTNTDLKLLSEAASRSNAVMSQRFWAQIPINTVKLSSFSHAVTVLPIEECST